MKNELGGKILTELVALTPKTYSNLMNDGGNDKKEKGTKTCVIERILKFNDYKKCLLNNEIILKSQKRFKSEANNVYTEEINKIALKSTMIRDCKSLTELDCIHMMLVLKKYVKQSC